VRILVGSFNALTDRAVLPADDVAATLRAVPGVLAWRDIRTRGEPGAVYVDLVAHVDGNLTLRAAHEVADRIEEALKAAHPGVLDVVVHVEPAP
jgi:ferrous-iron efflux pump FieF